MKPNPSKLFIVTLRFAECKEDAPRFMEAHRQWIAEGFEDGAFLVVGGLGCEGGCIVAHGITRAKLRQCLDKDPFVARRIATAEILELSPSRADRRLGFLAV